MRFCVYCKTRYTKDSGITFHRFSTNFKESWLKILKMDSKDLTPSTHLCSKHFSDDCFLRHNSRVAIKRGSVPTIFEVKVMADPLHSVEISPTRITEMGQGIQEVNVKQELDVAANECYEENHQQNKGTADNEGIIIKKEIKIELTSDDAYDNTLATDAANTEFQNSQVFETQESNSELINEYDDMIDIKYNMQTDKVKLEVLDDVGDGVSPGPSNDGNIKYNMQIDKVKLEVTDEVGYGVNPGASNEETIKHNMQTDKIKLEVSDNDGYGVSSGSSNDRNIKNNMQTDNIKLEVLYDVGDGVSPDASNNGTNEESLSSFNTYLDGAGAKLFSCNKCDFKTKYKSGLKSHLSKHCGEKMFACDKCDYKCRHKGSLNTHVLKHYKRPGETYLKRFSCDKCDYKCYRGKHLRNHLLIHTEEKCKQKTKLNSHLSLHSDKILSGQASMKLFVKLGENLWSCCVCDVKKKNKSSVIKHLNKKHGDKLFSCNQCGIKAYEERYLKIHLLKHTACGKCDYKFMDKARLQKHLLKHLKCNNEIFIKGLSCNHCK